ncbi:MAG: EamA family transporter [Deltaproteobacteria bacterium]|nr:EamA family transporter [Deltaproteobacteria bacterium]
MGYFYIFGTICFTVYGQMILKWQVNQAGAFPADAVEKAWFILRLLLNPWVVSSMIGAFLAFLCWMAAMTKFELSYAYPFTSLGFLLVMVLSTAFFGESITWLKALGVFLIIMGIIVGSQG